MKRKDSYFQFTFKIGVMIDSFHRGKYKCSSLTSFNVMRKSLILFVLAVIHINPPPFRIYEVGEKIKLR